MSLHGFMWGGSGLWLVLPTLAQAAPVVGNEGAGSRDPISTQLTVEPSRCVTAALLQRQVVSRSPRIAFVDRSAAHTVRVSFPVGDATQARIALGDGTHPDVVRQLWANTCEELTEAIAFVISVTLDPPSPPDPEPTSGADASDRAAPETSANRPDAAATDAPSGLSAEPVRRPSSSPASQRRRSDQASADAVQTTSSALQLHVGVGGQSSQGPAPEPMWGGSGFMDVVWTPVSNSWTGPQTLRFGLTAVFSPEHAARGGVASFQLFRGSVDACPLALIDSKPWTVSPCARFGGGALMASGRATVSAQSESRPWFEAGASLLAALQLSAAWRVNAQVAVSRPLLTYAFQFEPLIFHQVSPWSVELGLHVSTAL